MGRNNCIDAGLKLEEKKQDWDKKAHNKVGAKPRGWEVTGHQEERKNLEASLRVSS